MRFNELVENAALFTPMFEFGGIWVKPDGSHLECDYANDQHHPATYARSVGEECAETSDDYQHFMERAQSEGWVRLAKHGRTFLVEFEHSKISVAAIREVTRLLRMAGHCQNWEFSILGWSEEFKSFNDFKEAVRFWNQYRTSRNALTERADLSIARDHENMLTASIEGKPVAWYVIDRSAPGEVSLHANVDAAARRQGISKAVYDWAASYFAARDLKLVPFSRLSPEAYAMWQKRDPAAVAGYTRDGANYYR